MDQATHDIRRRNWLDIVNQCQQRSANITVHQWLNSNGIKEKAYYYWLHKFRKEAVGKLPVSSTVQTTDVSFVELSIPAKKTSITPASELIPVAGYPAAVIRCNGLALEISNDISQDLLAMVIQEVLHA